VLHLPLPDPIFGFHAQQSCEKLLKAWLSAHQAVYPLTHSLKTLIRLLQDEGDQLPKLPYDLLRLEPYAVQLRYDFGAGFDEAEKAEIIESVRTLRGFGLARILAIEGYVGP
jgi:HEPN domain-containing protein